MWKRDRWSISNEKRLNSKAYQHYLSRQAGIIEHFGNIDPESRVLELGSYPGTIAPHLMNKCHLILSDVSMDLLELRYQECNYLEARGEDIPMDDHSIDIIFMIDVFHHLHDFKAFTEEAWRVLKPNGRLIIFEAKKYHPIVIISNLIHGRPKEPYGLALFINPNFVTRNISDRFDLIKKSTFNSFFGFKVVLFPNLMSGIINYIEDNYATPIDDVMIFKPRSIKE